MDNPIHIFIESAFLLYLASVNSAVPDKLRLPVGSASKRTLAGNVIQLKSGLRNETILFFVFVFLITKLLAHQNLLVSLLPKTPLSISQTRL